MKKTRLTAFGRYLLGMAVVVVALPQPLPGNISAVWANDGGDKVTRDELRSTNHKENLTGTVLNKVWNGAKVSISGAKNEVVGFQVILEAASATANNVSVSFNTLTGPNSSIRTTSTDPQVWVNRPIEVFYGRYVQIQGLSFFGYQTENSQIPVRFRADSGQWTDRPDHDKFYPDPLVPVEKVNQFSINAGQSQTLWIDVFIPKSQADGLYKGTITVSENGTATKQIPVELTVLPFTLPDKPLAKTMVFLDNADILGRYAGGFNGYVQWDSPNGRKAQAVMDKYYQFLHRHKMGVIGENECPSADKPCDSSLSRLDGSLYTAAQGYDGPGIGTSNGIYSRGTYGTWGAATYGVDEWKSDQTRFLQHMDAYGSWMHQNLPDTDALLYLADEPQDTQWPDLERWSSWMAGSTKGAQYVKSFSTVSAVFAMEPFSPNIPHLQAPASTAGVGNCQVRQTSCDASTLMDVAANKYRQSPNQLWMYNDGHPGVGTFMTEADGIDPRTIPVAQFKKRIDRWFYWDANIARNIDMFTTATTWDDRTSRDPVRGMVGGTASNGNGLLIYPGTDIVHTNDSYNLTVPIASIRLKNWRWGIQVADYFAMADKVNHSATQNVINALMPKALWENKVQDPSWPITPISWSSDPDVWQNARQQLATIITGGNAPAPTPVPTPVPPVPTPTPTPVHVDAPSFATTGWAAIVSKNSGKCFEATSRTNGVFKQTVCTSQQRYRFTKVSGGYEITQRKGGLQLDIQGGPTATDLGATLIQYKYWGGTNEMFWLERSSDGYYLIHPSHSNLCLDVPYSSKDSGTPIQQWSCHDGDNQKWSIKQVN